ncbi:hypothetical protein IFM89_013627 [Coptis chinensis]|uniref:Pentatricopeptide repeat-containing protein n=1 Tax=Coptis chinensis TaxID=261450 RepID=A0A835IMT5_9MAGN|nr:hypothetical protein IFM89_013627 [Coptis chinensis]
MQVLRMSEDYGVERSVDHCGRLVDLLGREGHVEEACDLVRNMEVQPHVGVWGALLAASGVLGFTTMLKLAKLLQRSFSLWSLRIVVIMQYCPTSILQQIGGMMLRKSDVG